MSARKKVFEDKRIVKQIELEDTLKRVHQLYPHSGIEKIRPEKRREILPRIRSLLEKKKMRLGPPGYIDREMFRKGLHELKRSEYSRNISVKERAEIRREREFLEHITGIRV